MSGRPVIAGKAERECDMLGRATSEGDGGLREKEVEGVEGEVV
jgi:hypothetical protein